MTTQVGTFIPVQTQFAGLGINGLNQNSVLGFNTLNQNPVFALNGLNQNSVLGFNALNQNPTLGFNGLNQNSILALNGLNQNSVLGLNQNTALLNAAGYNQAPNNNQNAATVFVVPTYGSNFGELNQGFANNGTQIAFVPQAASVVTNSALQNMPTAAAVFGVANALQNAQQTVNSQSLATELSENNNEYVISFDVPGIEIQDLDISLAGNTILINGIRKNTSDASSLAYSEVARGSLSRAVAVPFDISPSKAINTSLENGVLKIRIAKENQSERKLTSRKVKIG